MKLQMPRHIRLSELMSDQKFENFKIQVNRWRPTRKLRKNFNFLLIFNQKQQKSANNRFHAKLVKYSNFYDIFADVRPILMKFCMMTRISYPEHNSCLKNHI